MKNISHLLKCKNVVKQYDGGIVFQDINLSIQSGEILSLVGPSGCGKTTLLRCIAGLEEVTEGQIWIGNKEISNQKPEHRPIVMIFQQPLLFPHLSVLENITYGFKAKKVSKKERRITGLKMLKKIEIEGYEDRYPFELSGGQQQRVALARALVMQPQLLLLDEPFSSLDPELRETMRSWVRMKLKDEGTTALFVTHDKEEAMIMGDQLAVMKDGMIQQVGDPLEIYQKPKNSKVAEFFSDGLVLNDQSFVPIHRLAIEPYMVKRNQEEGSSKQTGYTGIVTGKFMRHGQRFEQIEIPELGKKIVLPVQQNFHINDRVLVVINNGLAE